MTETSIGLTADGCRRRQERLRAKLAELELDAALLIEPRHVHYFSGHWEYSGLPCALLISQDEAPLLVTSAKTNLEIDGVTYEASRLATLVDDLKAALLQPLQSRLGKIKGLGCDGVLYNHEVVDLNPTLLALRRTKDEDEITVIRHAVSACEVAFARAREVLQPGVSEIEIYAQIYAAATIAAGERIGPMGNDFQSGSPGGQARTRAAQTGELMPLDVSIVVRGYSCDLTRTFSVDGQPTDLQLEAHDRVLRALDYIEKTARAGVSCRELYQEVLAQLDGYNGWRFPHHLGHGIGLAAHEAPRINPNWDDTLQVGDVIAAEPGIYGENLRAGIRIEQNYLVTNDGLERLSQYPVEL